MKEQIKELIQKGKLQKYVKKGEHSSFKRSNKNQSEFTPGTIVLTNPRKTSSGKYRQFQGVP